MPVSLPAVIAEEKSSRAESLVRTSRAFLMPSSSSTRSSPRVPHSLCFDSQAALVSSKKAMSAFIWLSVSS